MLAGIIPVPGLSMRGVNEAPTNLTSYTSAPPIVVSTSSDAATNEAWRAFDGLTTDYWQSLVLPASLTIDFCTQVCIESFTLTPRQDSTLPAPTAFTLSGSNDNSNFDVVSTQSGLTWTTAAQTFTPTALGFYRWYKFNCTASGNGANAGFAKCTMTS